LGLSRTRGRRPLNADQVGILFLPALQTPKSDRRTPPSSESLRVSDVAQDLAAQPSHRRTPLASNTSRTGWTKPHLILRLVSMTTPVRLDQKKAICAILFNQGDAPATLVLPGDGSYEARRTPIVAWSVLPADDPKASRVGPPTEPQFRPCGNLDALTRDQVFTLRPGETRVVETSPDLPGPG
jgi:hypothetical protein